MSLRARFFLPSPRENLMLRPDDQLVRDVRRALGSDHSIDSAAIHVSVQDGVAVLSGSVANSAAKEAATAAARRVPGIRRVFETIALRPADPSLDDCVIAQRVSTPGSGSTKRAR